MTTSSAVVSLGNIFQKGMAYVALSRTTSLKGLHITNYNEKAIYCDPLTQAAIRAMPKVKTAEVRPLLSMQSELVGVNNLAIVHHNCERLECHMSDITSHHEFMCADIICLTETFLKGKSASPALNIPGYRLQYKNRRDSYTFQTELLAKDGGGTAIYIRENVLAKEIRYMHNVTDLEFTAVKVQQPCDAIVITIYRDQKYSSTLFLKQLQGLLIGIEILNVSTAVICGDFNEDLLGTGRKPICNLLSDNGYKQLINRSTTKELTLLDAIYIKTKNAEVRHAGVIPTYFSYHDAVYCVLEL